MNYTLEQFKKDVIGWSTDKLIIKHGHVGGQLDKVKEEADETIAAIQIIDAGYFEDITEAEAWKEIKDGIGDTAVTLINIDAVQKSNTDFFEYDPEAMSRCTIESKSPIYFLNNVKNEAEFTQEDYIDAWFMLHCACSRLGLDFMECCLLAWNEIKDRKGYFCEVKMSFVKES